MPSTQSQSLIETVVAIGIIVVAIVAILSIGLTDLALGQQSGERVLAINLAREGLEIIYAVRNSNELDPSKTWPYGLTNDDWWVNFDDTELTGQEAAFSSGSIIEYCANCYLCRDETYDYYVQCVPTRAEDIFRRMISISDGDDLAGNCGAACEKKIVSTVYWTERGRAHTISLETRLTDWR